MKVSVIVPVFNVEKYLEQCLASIEVQTLKEFEVLCVNDGSTDSSESIITKFVNRDPRFKLISKPNAGYGHSMNLGISQASGDYVSIIESDDFVEPDMLEKLYEEAIGSGADVVKADFYYYWSRPEEKRVAAEVLKNLPKRALTNAYKCREIFSITPSIWSGMYKNDFLKKNNICFLETPGASYQDTGFIFKVWCFAESVIFIEDKLVHYRQDNEGSSINNKSKVFCINEEFSEMEKFVKENFGDNTFLMQSLFLLKYKAYEWNFRRVAKEFKKLYLKRMSLEFKEAIKRGEVKSKVLGSKKYRNSLLIAYFPRFYYFFN